MMSPSKTQNLAYCRLCRKVAHHTITDERQKTGHLCCYHYGKFFLEKNELCIHNTYPEVTYDCGEMNGYKIRVTYKILPEHEQKQKEQELMRILGRVQLRQAIEKAKSKPKEKF